MQSHHAHSLLLLTFTPITTTPASTYQVVAGINHVLHLEVSDDAGTKDVEVTVWEKLPANVQANESPLELTASKLLGGPAAQVRGCLCVLFECRQAGLSRQRGRRAGQCAC